MERLPSPDFSGHVEWLRLGDQQLHLFLADGRRPSGTTSPSTSTISRRRSRRRRSSASSKSAPSAPVRELNDGAVEMYLRDPAGNLVEVDLPDVLDARPVDRHSHDEAVGRDRADARGAARLALSQVGRGRGPRLEVGDGRVRPKDPEGVHARGLSPVHAVDLVGRRDRLRPSLGRLPCPALRRDWVRRHADQLRVSGSRSGSFLATLLDGLTAAGVYFVVASGSP